MEDQRDVGRPIQILRIEGGSHFILDIDQLQRILLDDNVRNLPVVVVSVAGAFRKGKSFLLNFFLQYMRNRTQDDWLDVRDAPLKGFPSRGGSEPETMGILMWEEIFVVTTTEGKRMAVLFLDTQGIFDGRSTVEAWTTISAFSTIASSVQIYNLSQNIGEDKLQYLQVFTEYGRLALQAAEEKPFQKLLFVVRDWQYVYEKPYGFEGGNSLLEQRLSVYDEQDQELQHSRLDIKSAFSEICCFLMPYPGKKVASGKFINGCLSDIDEDFKEQLRVLVPSILDESKLLVKNINGSDMTCQQLLTCLQQLIKVFNSGDLPKPKSILEATAETSHMMAFNRAIEHYRRGMEEVCDDSRPYLDAEFLHEKHLRLRQSAVDVLVKAPNISRAPRSHEHKETLLAGIDQLFQRFSMCNEGRRIKAESTQIKEEATMRAKEILEKAGVRVDENGDTVQDCSYFRLLTTAFSAIKNKVWGVPSLELGAAGDTAGLPSMDHEVLRSQDNATPSATGQEENKTKDAS